MTPVKSSPSRFTLLVFSGMLAISSLTGCGGPSREEVRTLGSLIDQFQMVNREGDRQLASGAARPDYPFILATYEKRLEILKSHRATHKYKGEIKGHLDAMEEGLKEGVEAYRKWIDAGYDSKNPAPDVATAVSNFGIKLTAAETALTIAAGR